jgi:hypothetical protein
MSETADARAKRLPGSEYGKWADEKTSDAGRQRSRAVRVAILLLRQASVANVATVYEDLQAVNMLAPGPSAGLRFRPTIVADGDLPRWSISGLAVSLIFGLLVSTLLTLLVIPVVYYHYHWRGQADSVGAA